MKAYQVLIGMAGFIVLGGLRSLANACACPIRTTSARVYEAKSVVFAEAVSDLPIKGAAMGKPSRKVKLRVLEQFRGESPSVFWRNDYSIQTPGCGADFLIGSKYVIFLDDKDKDLVSSCHVMQTGEITPELRKELIFIPGDGPRPPQEVDPKRASALHYIAGMKSFQNENYEDARKEWTLAAQIDPSNDDARAGLVRLDRMNLKEDK